MKVQIPKPCSQSWDEMTLENGGRHCAACSKTVTDFTRMSDAQILEVLRATTSDCGRFRVEQLNRELMALPAEKRFSFASFYKLAASLLLVLSASNLTAQTKKSIETTTQEKKPPRAPRGKVIISGIVKDQFGNPLIGSMVSIEDSKIGTMAGINGEFEFSVPDSMFSKNPENELVVKCNYIGAREYSLRVQKEQLSKTLNIVMNIPEDDVKIKVVQYGGMIKDFSTVAPRSLFTPEFQKGKIPEDIGPKKWWQFWKHSK